MKKIQKVAMLQNALSTNQLKKIKGGLGTGLWVCVADLYECYQYIGQCYAYCSRPNSCRFYNECP